MGAALVGALAALPQAVAYGLIATLPLGSEWTAFGIMASVGSAIVFGILSGIYSSNPFMVSGPSAVTAVVLATSLHTATERGYAAPDALVLAFAGVVVAGIIQLLAGILRLGHVVSYVPVPVLAGFVNASALIVLFNSLPMILGLPNLDMSAIVGGGIAEASLWALLVSGLTIFCNFVFEGRVRFIPAALIGLAAGSLAYHLGMHFAAQPAGPEIGHIDLLGLWKMPLLLDGQLSWPMLWHEADIPLLGGLSIGLLAAFNSALTGAALDMRTGIEGNVNKDLRSHGLINALMGLLGYLPASGALSRSTAALNGGARTRAANVGVGLMFALILTLLAPLVAALPLWATSGMLAATAIQALDKGTIAKIRGIVSRSVPYPRVLAGDVVVTLVVVVAALALNLIAAIVVGIVLAVALFVLGMGRDPVRRTLDGSKYHSKVLRPSLQTQLLDREGHRIAIIEVQGALFFGACARLHSKAKALFNKGAEFLILDLRNMTSIDSTGCALLRTLAINCVKAGGHLLISRVEPERRLRPAQRRVHQGKPANPMYVERAPLRWIWLNLEANGVLGLIGDEWIFDDTDIALASCEDILLERYGKSGSVQRRGIIASSGSFAGLTREQIISIGRYTKRHRFDKNETVFVQGSVRKRRVSSLTEGTVFAEMGVIDGALRSATIRAVRQSACFSINAEDFEQLQNDLPDVALVLLRNLNRQFANRLRHANAMISELEQ